MNLTTISLVLSNNIIVLSVDEFECCSDQTNECSTKQYSTHKQDQVYTEA